MSWPPIASKSMPSSNNPTPPFAIRLFKTLVVLVALSVTAPSARAQWSVNAGIGLRTSFATSADDLPVVGGDQFVGVLFVGASYHLDFFATDRRFGISPGIYLWGGEDGGVYTIMHNGQFYDYTPRYYGLQMPLLFTASWFPSDRTRLTLALGPAFGLNASFFSGPRFDDDPYIKHITTPQYNFSLAVQMGIGLDYRRLRLQLGTAIESMQVLKTSSETLLTLSLGLGYVF